RRLPKGVYRNRLTMDGYNKPLTLAATMTIADGGIHVDFTGTSPASSHGINVVLNYTLAYTAFGVKCLIAPEVPNNAGSLAPITVQATETIAPVLFRRREFREGSGGAGEFRGGLGQVIEVGGADGMPVSLLCNFERVQHPARGRAGGAPGGAGRVTLLSGRPI